MTMTIELGRLADAAARGAGGQNPSSSLDSPAGAIRPLGQIDDCLVDQIVGSLHPGAPSVSSVAAAAGVSPALPVSGLPSALPTPPRSLPSPTVYQLDGGVAPLLPEQSIPRFATPPAGGLYFLPGAAGEADARAAAAAAPHAANPAGHAVPHPSAGAVALPPGTAWPPGDSPSGAQPTFALAPIPTGSFAAPPAASAPAAATPYFLPSTPTDSTSLPPASWPGAAPPRPEASAAEDLHPAPLVPARPGAPGAGFLPPAVPTSSADGLPSVRTLPRSSADGIAPPSPPAQSYYALPPAGAAPARADDSRLARPPFDVTAVRRDFPILQERIHGKQLVWLDNAATTQKPRAVIDRLVQYYEHEYSNVHRGAHTLAARSTDAYEQARETVARFLNAATPREIVFLRGTTEAINLVANSWGRKFLRAGDEIVLTTLEHHSNIVPWQFLAETHGVVLRVVPVTDRGEVLLADFTRVLGPRTRFVAITHVSNALGTVLPVAEMTHVAHRYGARVLIDGAQAVSHFPVDVQALDADFYTLSSHKLFGPSAAGVLYGKSALFEDMPPWQGGGNMIERVTFERSSFAAPPMRFEAGTATLAPAVGLGAAIEYLERVGMPNVARHEHELVRHATEALGSIPGVRLIGTAPEKAGVVSFLADGVGVEEMGGILDQDGIAVRAGHHCAQPTMDRFGLTGTVRPSFALYNTHDEVEQLARAVYRAIQQRR